MIQHFSTYQALKITILIMLTFLILGVDILKSMTYNIICSECCYGSGGRARPW